MTNALIDERFYKRAVDLCQRWGRDPLRLTANHYLWGMPGPASALVECMIAEQFARTIADVRDWELDAACEFLYEEHKEFYEKHPEAVEDI